MARVDLPRHRRSFATLENALELPNLIDIQRSSFEWLTDPDKGGLRETIDDISPIEDYTGNLAVVFGELWFDEPPASIAECREKAGAEGSFQATIDLQPGSYRARVAAAKGYATGLSKTLMVVSR